MVIVLAKRVVTSPEFVDRCRGGLVYTGPRDGYVRIHVFRSPRQPMLDYGCLSSCGARPRVRSAAALPRGQARSLFRC